jgi:uncharacterized protein YcbK (DUF882 family)
LKFSDDVRDKLDVLRELMGIPLPVTSGYRCPDHPIEARKESGPGAHSTGLAVDIGVQGKDAHRLIALAMMHDCPRIGINQKGSGRFIHLDWDYTKPNPTIWSY